jgi:flagellar basal-body rod protein FlgG
MNNQLITSSTTLSQLLKRLDTISHNIANVNTSGYKSKQANFHDVLQQIEQNHIDTNKEVGRVTPYGVNVGLGAKISGINFTHTQGSVNVTNRDLDIMINGNWAYFRTMDANNQISYTRNGELQVIENPNATGEMILAAANGEPLLDRNNQQISFKAPYSNLSISSKGEVAITDANGTVQNYELSIAKITRPDLLQANGTNGFTLTGSVEDNLANGTLEVVNLVDSANSGISLQQGALEMSNVNLTDEMTNLMTTQRMIQLQGRAISMADQMMGIANSIRG